MKRLLNWKLGTVILVCTVYLLVYGIMQRNLSLTTAAIASQKPVIVIDAGHGGEDGGTTGIGGASESQINLSIALRLDQLLSFTGFQTHMIRDTDQSVYTTGNTISERKVSDLKKRVALTNQISPAILVSIHQNHFSEEKYSGAQVFYAATNGSKYLAELTQEQLRQSLAPENKRTSKKADSVYLMNQIRCTGILVECGFLSNREEELRLLQPEYQKKIACAIGCALSQYLYEGDNDFEI